MTRGKKSNWKRIEKINISLPDFVMPKIMYVGIDPGTVNLGIACIIPSINVIELFQCEIERLPNAVERILDLQELFPFCIPFYSPNYKTIIEGASYGDKYRQVELEQVRTTAVIWSQDRASIVKIIPPQTIRKTVFGKASIKAHDVWKDIPQDCAAALSCALFDFSEYHTRLSLNLHSMLSI
jgi:Holliday junction resolvasome RuvABC endonuclease subunit